MKYPKHVALIPDGNRTWAKENNLPQIVGHMEGSKKVVSLMKYILGKTPIQVFTVWGLSTENLKSRTQDELDYLFDIYKNFLSELEEFFENHKISFRWIGNPVGLPENLVSFLNEEQIKYRYDSEKTLIIAVNYGGRDEIIRGVNDLLKDASFDVNDGEVTEEQLSNYLDLGNLPNVDLVLRTKGDVSSRLSGFMLWWIGYAELYFSDKKCPELDQEEFDKALAWFDEIQGKRNFGK